jgi:iron complex outermembrane receptor protein
VNASTAFETPTTTELNARPDGDGGFNPDLDPQRLRTLEAGARGTWRSWLRYEAAVFQVDTRDAIVQYLETAGRAYFRNAGRTRNRGLEVGFTAAATRWLTFRGAVTLSDYTFLEYRVPSATLPAPALDTLDGNRVAGVPGRAWRLGALMAFGDLSLDLDHSVQSPLWANDANTVRVPGWDRGQLNVRLAWSGAVRGWRVEPFAALQNALDSRYAGAVTLNGAFGRVFEPAPRRNWYAGLAIGAPLLR